MWLRSFPGCPKIWSRESASQRFRTPVIHLLVDAPVPKPQPAWLPLTRAGVARFAHASWRRLLLVQCIVALLTGVVLVLFLRLAWYPVIDRAIHTLPAQGQIRASHLEYRGENSMVLAENAFLSIGIDLHHSGAARTASHIQIEFGQDNIRLFSFLGFVEVPYPRYWQIAFNRSELEPWWGAWGPPFLFLAVCAAVSWLLIIWSILAVLYAGPAWLIGFFANRDLNLKSSWRLASASLLPGALFFTTAFFFYAIGAIGLIRLGMAWAAHFLVSWIYLIISVPAVPRLRGVTPTKTNPFVR